MSEHSISISESTPDTSAQFGRSTEPVPGGARPSDWRDRLTQELQPGTICRRDEPLSKRTTLRVGGCADLYIEPQSESELGKILRFCGARQIPWFLLGRGSNLLIRDSGIRGVVLGLAHALFSEVQVISDELRCGAGARLKQVAVEARRHGLGGLEFLEGIPGTVGGALRMNAGAMGSSTFSVVDRVRLMNGAGEVLEKRASEIPVRYRSCPLLKDHIALGAVFKGEAALKETVAEKMGANSRKRWESQPSAPSAGCIFKNPITIPAGRLIEELGLKGHRHGGAMVSDVHGNFIVNEGGATAQDVLALIELIRERAWLERGIELETEVEIVGE